MSDSRRGFLKSSAAVAAGFMGLKSFVNDGSARAAEDAAATGKASIGYGPLVTDPKGLLDLPRGFSYRIISEEGNEMSDGLLVPG